MHMNFNPFSKTATVPKMFGHMKRLNMFDRTVGSPGSMGIFDYALVLPFLIKLGYAASENKSKFLRGLFGALSAPFAIAKFAIYIATSPLVLLAWGIKEGAKKGDKKFGISSTVAAINQLEAIAVAKPGQDPDTVPVTPLENIIKLHNADMYKYSIRAKNGNLQLVTFPGGTLVATITSSRKNIVAMQNIIPENNDNRLGYFMNNAGRNIFDHDAHQYIRKTARQQAKNATLEVYKTLVKSKHKADENINQGEVSFVEIPCEVRKLIADRVILDTLDEKPEESGIYPDFRPAEKEAAITAYMSHNKIR